MRRTLARTTGWLLLAALAGLAGAPNAQAEDAAFEQAMGALGEQTLEALDALAERCHKAKLFAWRNEVYEQVLLFDADHKQARTWLKYRRTAEGAWTRGAYKAPRNLTSPKDEHKRARAAVGQRFANQALQLLAEHRASVAPARRQAVLRRAALLAPDHQDVRTALGEVRTAEGGWMLRESIGAAARRVALAAYATAALEAAAAPKQDRPTRTDNGLGVGWSAVFQSEHGRVLGSVEDAELVRAARRVDASYATFLHAFGIPAPKAPPLSLYLLASDKDRDAVLRNHPASTDAYRAWAKKLQSSWLPKTTDIWIHAPDADLRLEWCSRQVMAHLLSRSFGVRGAPGWAFEGCGLYLSHLVAGQRRTFFVKRTEYVTQGTRKDDLWERLRDKATDWRKEARALLASDAAPDLRLLLGKPLNAMNTEDMLASFALCAFLIEGRPEELPALLTKVGKDKQPSVDVLTAAGLDPETLIVTLRRWLEETT